MGTVYVSGGEPEFEDQAQAVSSKAEAVGHGGGTVRREGTGGGKGYRSHGV